MNKFKILVFSIILVLNSYPQLIKAQLIEKKTISLELAKKLASIAESEAAKNNWTVAIAIVDDGGNLIHFCKMDDTQIGSIEVSIQKAKSAINFKRTTKAFEDAVLAGRMSILSLPGAIPLEGGVPFIVNNQFVGAIGISGAKSNEDGVVAKAAVDYLNSLHNKK